MKKRLFVCITVLALFLAMPIAALGITRTLTATFGITVIKDGTVVDYTYPDGTKAEAFISDGVTYLPVRAIAEACDLDVSWDAPNQTVTLTSAGYTAPAEQLTVTGQPEEDGDSTDNLTYAQQVLKLVNQYRVDNGLDELSLSSDLSNVAQAKVKDMHDNDYFAHESPTYGTPFQMMQSFGVSYSAAGENIARGHSSPAEVVEGWMNSAVHRANILSSSFTQIGLGYYSSGNYWSQMFIG